MGRRVKLDGHRRGLQRRNGGGVGSRGGDGVGHTLEGGGQRGDGPQGPGLDFFSDGGHGHQLGGENAAQGAVVVRAAVEEAVGLGLI